MQSLLALLAAFALAFGPAAARAGAPGCGMDRGGMAAMEGMGSPPAKSADPLGPKDKACAAMCALVGQAVCATPSVAPKAPVAGGSVRFAVAAALPPRPVDVRTDTPPPRTPA